MSGEKSVKKVFIEDGWEFTQETTKVIDGVYLHIIDGAEACLTVGKFELEFTYDEKAKRVFEGLLKGSQAIELLEVLSR